MIRLNYLYLKQILTWRVCILPFGNNFIYRGNNNPVLAQLLSKIAREKLCKIDLCINLSI